MSDLHPIFQDVCPDDSPLDITTPFVIGDFIYATDGSICVRCPRGDDRSDERRGRVPPADRLEWGAPDAEAVILPDVGNGMTTCEVCEGTRTVEGFECVDCDGKGFYRDCQGVEVGPILLAKHYIAKLRRHGLHQVYPKGLLLERRRKPTTLPAAYFVGDGFEGLLMSMERGPTKLIGIKNGGVI